MEVIQPPPVQVGVIIAHAPSSPRDAMREFAQQLVSDVQPELQRASGRSWNFNQQDPFQMDSDERRHGGDFLGEASMRLVEGSFDLVLVITDVPLTSRRERMVFGLVSPLARTIVLSTHRLRDSGRGKRLPVDSSPVRWNAATLLLHLIGQALGAKSRAKGTGAMSPFQPRTDPSGIPQFESSSNIGQAAARFTEHEHFATNPLVEFRIHIGAALRHPGLVTRALLRNRAPLLPLKMPGLATAAVAPIFVLVFSAEFWDAGLGMGSKTAAIYAAVTILAAASYLCFARRLFLPRRADPIVPEHLAVANVVIFMSMLFALIGLFAMVAALALTIELWVFPSDLISTWPTLKNQRVGLPDLVRLSVFISTVGVTTGALGGALERRETLRQMALFQIEV